MPKHSDFEQIYQNFIRQYGKKKGEQLYYAWLNEHKFDDTKPYPKKDKPKHEVISLNKDFNYELAITKIDSDSRTIEGYASSDAIDSDGERILRTSFSDTLVTYMRNPVIRYMHERIPIGKALEAKIDENGLKVKAYITDKTEKGQEVWGLIKEGILKAFSIGGKVIETTIVDGVRTITKVSLKEISVVDIPANPNSFFSVVKMAAFEDISPSEITLVMENEVKPKELEVGENKDGGASMVEQKVEETSAKKEEPVAPVEKQETKVEEAKKDVVQTPQEEVVTLKKEEFDRMKQELETMKKELEVEEILEKKLEKLLEKRKVLVDTTEDSKKEGIVKKSVGQLATESGWFSTKR